MLTPRRSAWILVLTAFLAGELARAQQRTPFHWPADKRAALSLSFDDARESQLDVGLALLEKYGAKATFYVYPAAVISRQAAWQRAAAAGHEIGNHTLTHPCTGNFDWVHGKPSEDYTLGDMRDELTTANHRIKELLGVTPKTFAYTCGHTFVGRGTATRSYVPLVAELFTAGRGWLDETPNDPTFCDLAKVTGMKMDDADFEQILPLLEGAKRRGQWVVLAGHEVGPSGELTTRVKMLERLLRYAKDPENRIWLAPVGDVAEYISTHRTAIGRTPSPPEAGHGY